MGQGKSKHQGFKKAKKRTWDSASLMGQCKSGGKDFRRDYVKEQLRENIFLRVNLRKETLKNRKRKL
jgi:hypothetical protein